MKKLLLLFVAVMTMTLSVSAQNQRVTGIVFGDDTGEPLVGATVVGVGTSEGTLTNLDGVFDLLLPMNVKQISISYVGMKTEVVDITPGQMSVTLASDNKLDEVIAVAFGTAKKSAFTGSASVVNADDLNKRLSSNVANALVGTVPGLQMRGASGAPGSNDGKINIRGIASMYASTDPLVIVDGSPYTASLANIPQGDIESISVLKDAASAALYGARGAAGVIIVTTKNGSAERSKVSVDMKWGANTRADRDYDLVTDPAEYYEAAYKYWNNYATSAGLSGASANNWANNTMMTYLGYNIYNVPDGEKLIGLDGKLNPNATKGRTYTAANGETYYLTNDNWNDEAYRTALRQEYNVSVTGGNEKSSFYASAGYLDEGGVIEYSSYRRFTGRLKADYKVKPWLKVGANVGYVHSSTESTPNLDQSSGAGNLMYYTNNIAPIYPVYVRVKDANGNIVIKQTEHGPMYDYARRPNGYVSATNASNVLSRPFAPGENPLSNIRYNNNNQYGNQLNATLTADIQITSHLKANLTNNAIWGLTERSDYQNPYFGSKQSVNGELLKSNTNSYRSNFIQTLTYTNQWGDHSLTALAGHEYYREQTKFLSATAQGGFTPDVEEIYAFAYKQTSNSYSSKYNVEGFFASAQYDYDGKYFASASYRLDGSSRFAVGKRWGSFWSIGGAWLVNKDFTREVKWIDQLKLKASVGQQGNDNIGNFAYTDLYQLSPSSQLVMAPSFYRIGEKSITWEKTTNWNIGAEFAFFGNRLSGGVDFYYKKTTDLLFWLNVPESMGSRGYYGNLGDIRNMGVEAQINGAIIRNKSVDWSINFNFTHNSNKILKLPASQVLDKGGFAMSDDARVLQNWYRVGGSMYQAFMIEPAGIDENGQQLFWQDSDICEVNEEGQVVSDITVPGKKRDQTTTDPNAATNYVQKTSLPWLYGGFGTTLNVGRVDCSVAFDYQLGGKIYDTRYAGYMNPSNVEAGSNIHRDWIKSWNPDSETGSLPVWMYGNSYANAQSTRFLTDASYLNFANFTVGYTFPSFIPGIEKLRVYAQGENLCYWSKRKGLDPRYSFTSAASIAAYNPIRTISGGIQVVF